MEARKGMNSITRRGFLCGASATALVSASVLHGLPGWAEDRTRAARYVFSLDHDWLFGGELTPKSLEPNFDDAAFSRVSLPHCPVPLSWQEWNPEQWEKAWIYRRHFDLPPQSHGLRFFLRFDRVMAGAAPVVNGHAFPKRLGGFLPFGHEVTGMVRDRNNVLAVAVDSQWLNAPPSGSPKGPKSIDYLLPGGMIGGVSLYAVPRIFIRDVFSKPVNVLSADRRLDIACELDAASGNLPATVHLEAKLEDASGTVAHTSQATKLVEKNQTIQLTMTDLETIKLWNVGDPNLYHLVVTLLVDGKPVHQYSTRVGFRDARFEVDGFFLNGKRLRLFGLDRHELYPYGGFAVPDRLLRRDADILRNDFNCNAVRCSHYPQSEAFMDRCDELGLLVWEEIPGWQYLGDESWRDVLLRDVREMVIRDRNRPSVIIWGVRVNESANDPALYERTRRIAKSLDDSRPTSGTMTPSSMKTWRTEWHQDVFAFDDYHARPDGTVGIRKPLPGVPYLITEAVGQFNYPARQGFDLYYRRAGDVTDQMRQAIFHAQAHSRAANYPRCAGLIAWCAFEYASLMNGIQGVKYPGVADFFRIPKLGASFYLAQCDPAVRAVIEPNFYWYFGSETPFGPGENAAIFSNCERLELSVNGKPHSTVRPDWAGYPHLKHPPFFSNLAMGGIKNPELRIDGYVKDQLVLSRSLSADTSTDRLHLAVGDAELEASGLDATWLTFRAVDRFGAPRPFVGGSVHLTVSGPGEIVGDNPFNLGESGGAGAVWIKAKPRTGIITVKAVHPTLGEASIQIRVRSGAYQEKSTA